MAEKNSKRIPLGLLEDGDNDNNKNVLGVKGPEDYLRCFDNESSVDEKIENFLSLLLNIGKFYTETECKVLRRNCNYCCNIFYMDVTKPLKMDIESGDVVMFGTVKYLEKKDKKTIHSKKLTFLTLRVITSVCFLLIGIMTTCTFFLTSPWNICILKQGSSWDRTYHGIELKGRLNVVRGTCGGSNLVGMFQGSLLVNDYNDKFPSGGVISIIGSSGLIAWWTQLLHIPMFLNCFSIDGNKDGVEDCLVQAKEGYFGLLDSTSGAVIWNMKNREDLITKYGMIEELSTPVITQDINKDGVRDVITLCKFHLQKVSGIILVSGKTGEIIGDPLFFNDCLAVEYLKIYSDPDYYKYTCTVKNATQTIMKEDLINLDELLQKVTNSKLIKINDPGLKQTQEEPQRTFNNHYVYVGNTMSIKHWGQFNTLVKIGFISDPPASSAFSYTALNTYVMDPQVMEFKSHKYLYGHALKFWQWSEDKYEVLSNNTLTVKLVNVRVDVFVVNNQSITDIVNADQADVTQLCNGKEMCQPSLSSHLESFIVLDLDGDGKHNEIVSYRGTYKRSENNWKLETNIKGMRFEKELPKLY